MGNGHAHRAGRKKEESGKKEAEERRRKSGKKEEREERKKAARKKSFMGGITSVESQAWNHIGGTRKSRLPRGAAKLWHGQHGICPSAARKAA